MSRKKVNKYDRVMSRISSESRVSLNSPVITDHRVGSLRASSRNLHSNISSGVFSDLPMVLNDYIPPEVDKPSRVVRPRKTLKSLDSMKISASKPKVESHRVTHVRPKVMYPSSTSFTSQSKVSVGRPGSEYSLIKLKEIQEEIHCFRDREKEKNLRNRLFKSCGLVLDEQGQVAAEKAVQVCVGDDAAQSDRSEQHCGGAHAGAAVSHQQMRTTVPAYPVDRYLVRGSNKIDIININEDDIWKVESAIRPEDEIMLSKLQDMLQSTAEELKILSEEMSKYHEPGGVQVKAAPTPLDEAFNEKVHIEQVINAKFLGLKIIDPVYDKKENTKEEIPKKANLNNIQTILRAPKKQGHHRNLSISRTRTVQINGMNPKIEKKSSEKQNLAPVSYDEISFKEKPVLKPELPKSLKIQELPKINIRSELKQQKIFSFDIMPESSIKESDEQGHSNVAVVEINAVPVSETEKPIASFDNTKYHQPNPSSKHITRKTLKLSTCESSESAEQTCSDMKNRYTCSQKANKRNTVSTARSKTRSKSNNINLERKNPEKCSLIDDFVPQTKKPVSSKSNRLKLGHNKVTEFPTCSLSNKDYVPYSKLTLGGINVDVIEREQKSVAFEDIPLSPIINKLIENQENFSSDGDSKKDSLSLPILSSSDEHNLDDRLKSTLIDTAKETTSDLKPKNNNDSSTEKKYDDDFEDPAATDISGNSANLDSEAQDQAASDKDKHDESVPVSYPTFTRASKLTFKDKVDVIEFIHSIDRKDNATQSSFTQNRLTETQISPRSTAGVSNIQPIHNDLWPLEDESDLEALKDVTKMFKLEKDVIKQFIVEEYGDILKKGSNNSTRPSSSKNDRSSQKNTQTSPARVKSVMTSPKLLKTRTTSPFTVNLTLDRTTSPMLSHRQAGGDAATENIGLTINVSSPRPSLDLPKNSRQVLSNLQNYGQTKIKLNAKSAKNNITSSESVDADFSSSEISSLGEIKFKLKRKVKNVSELSSDSSSSVSSSSSQASLVMPLKSEGELSTRYII